MTEEEFIIWLRNRPPRPGWVEAMARLKPVYDACRAVDPSLSGVAEIDDAHYRPQTSAAANLLASDLLHETDGIAIEVILTNLHRGAAPFDAGVLLRAMDRPDMKPYVWQASDVLWETNSEVPAEGLIAKLRDTSLGEARALLCYAAAKHLPPAVARRELLARLKEFPGHAVEALGKSGGAPADIPRVEQLLSHKEAWVRREAKKAIERINRRAAKAAAQAPSGGRRGAKKQEPKKPTRGARKTKAAAPKQERKK